MLKLWAPVFLFGAPYVLLIYLFPAAFAWSLIPTMLMAVATTTVYLHRCRTHRSFRMAGWLVDWHEFSQWFAIGSKTAEWVAVHRTHHAHSDAPGDPHSPLLDGLIPEVLPLNVFKYRQWLRDHAHEVPKICRDILDSERPAARFFNKHRWAGLPTGIAFMTGITWLIHGTPAIGLAAAYIHFVTFVFILNPLINGLCHWPHQWLGGYQHSTAVHALTTWNNWVVALLTGGEGFHHNHHWEQRTTWLAKYWYEKPADWGCWLFILPFVKLGAISDLRHAKEHATKHA